MTGGVVGMTAGMVRTTRISDMLYYFAEIDL
jgi:hypothetical protein